MLHNRVGSSCFFVGTANEESGAWANTVGPILATKAILLLETGQMLLPWPIVPKGDAMISPSRVNITFYISGVGGGIAALLVYDHVARTIPLRTILSPVSNLWIRGLVILLFGALFLGCSGYVNLRRYLLTVSVKKADFISILCFFVAGMIGIYGMQLFALGVLSLILLTVGAIFDLRIL